jgi:CRISPR-associated protein Csb2
VAWLEQHSPVGIIIPDACATSYTAVRHRTRVAVDVKEKRDLHRDETPFEPFSALSAPIIYAWPIPPAEVRDRLAAIAREITHVGRADSVVTIAVVDGEFSPDDPQALLMTSGRGPGRALRVAEPGRWDVLVAAHQVAHALERGRHVTGGKGKQTKDIPVPTAGEKSTRLARFAREVPHVDWPYNEAWLVPLDPEPPRWAMRTAHRVRSAVAVHRAIVAAIGEDVPLFVTGRDGANPLRGRGHLSIQFVPNGPGAPSLVFGVPPGLPDADRARLLDALADGPTARIGGQRVTLGEPRLRSATSFWPSFAETFATATPMIVDAPGKPRRQPWTLDDAVVCSVGYALRGALEAGGVEWGEGWGFRRDLVTALRRRGVDARSFRIHGGSSRFSHRGREGDLLVAAHALVRLGELANGGRGLLALGRARHLGGGLLQPLSES